MNNAIAYYRVSTSRQGKSGLGLEAQQSAVEQYCRLNGYLLMKEVTEIQSTRKHRIGLYQALDLCRHHRAALVVARLDRLGRDVEQIAGIVKSDVDIIVTDNPHANRFTIHILAAVAEEQRQRISETTRQALSAAKKRGVELGKNGKILSVTNRQAADDFANKLSPILRRLKSRGIVSTRAVSKELNKKGVPTFRIGGKWHPSTVHTLITRLNKQQINNNNNVSTMTATFENDILFDDVTITQNQLKQSPSAKSRITGADFDCSNYTSADDTEVGTA